MRVAPPSAHLRIAALAACFAGAACDDGRREAAPHAAGERHASTPTPAAVADHPSPAPPGSDTARPPLADPDSLQPGRPWRTAARYLATLRFADEFPSSETQPVLVSAECGLLRVTIAPERRSQNLRQDDFRGTVRVLARVTADRLPSRCATPSLAELGLGGEDRTSYLVADGAGGAYWMFREDSAIRFSRRWRLVTPDGVTAVPAPMARWWPRDPTVRSAGPEETLSQFAAAWIVCAESQCTAMSPVDTTLRHEP
jgi:hypothetical protein